MKRAQGSSVETAAPDATHLGMGIGIDMSSGGVDEAADRALTSVAQKLDRALSAEYTVNELIAEATDPANLACMFHGMLFLDKSCAYTYLRVLFVRLEPALLRDDAGGEMCYYSNLLSVMLQHRIRLMSFTYLTVKSRIYSSKLRSQSQLRRASCTVNTLQLRYCMCHHHTQKLYFMYST